MTAVESETAIPSASTVPGAATLLVDHVSRRIGTTPIVSDVVLRIAAGELMVLVGPSGCGKSTLLRLIAGLDPASGGRVVLDGVDVTALPAERRRIGLVFQDHALFPHRRVDQNVAFGLKHLDRATRRARVAELLELVRLPGMAKRYPHELSGGEQQRIALARALAPDPAVVLLDEPFANLDESLRDDVRRDVLAALRARQATALFVTHDREEALAIADRVAVMGGGRIHQVDHPSTVYERPRDPFVAQFLGPASLLPCPGLGVAGTEPCSDGCRVMVRPHDLTLDPGGPAVVVGRQYLGAAWRHEVALGDGEHVEVDTTSSVPFETGSRCTVRVIADHPLHHLPVAGSRPGDG